MPKSGHALKKSYEPAPWRDLIAHAKDDKNGAACVKSRTKSKAGESPRASHTLSVCLQVKLGWPRFHFLDDKMLCLMRAMH